MKGQNQMFIIAPKISPSTPPQMASMTGSQRRWPGNFGSKAESRPIHPVANIW